MFNFEDYTKNFEKVMSQSPFKIDDAVKSMMDYNTKVGKIALDTVKKIPNFHNHGQKRV